MRKSMPILSILLLGITLTACSNVQNHSESNVQSKATSSTISNELSFTESTLNSNDEQKPQTSVEVEDNETFDETEEQALKMVISNTPVSVKWEDNESVDSLKELCKDQPVIISMSMYGGFEQVGAIGADLPRNDIQTPTSSGDIVLYSGNQLVVFYGSNSWAYTMLGHITDKTPQEMTELLSGGNVTITLSI